VTVTDELQFTARSLHVQNISFNGYSCYLYILSCVTVEKYHLTNFPYSM